MDIQNGQNVDVAAIIVDAARDWARSIIEELD